MIKYFYDRLPHDTRRSLYASFRKGSYRVMQQKRKIVTGSGTSYKPFDDNKCIFVQIPGTAGPGVSRALFGNLAGGHDSLDRYRLVFSKSEFDGYFKFCFVRNPWDRVLSAYNYLMSDGAGERDKSWAKCHLAMYPDFVDFVERGLTLASVLELDYFMPQYKFMTLPASDEPAVDFVGRYENLEEDFDFVKKKLDKGRKSATRSSRSNAGRFTRRLQGRLHALGQGDNRARVRSRHRNVWL